MYKHNYKSYEDEQVWKKEKKPEHISMSN